MKNYLRIGLAICLTLWSFIGVSWADDAPHPLTPADTSSPAATLDSFLTNTTAHYQSGDRIAASFLASGRLQLSADELAQARQIAFYAKRATQCLDLSQVPEALILRQGPEFIILLKEVLDRVKLPPREEWPTLEAVAAQGLESWRIPGTEITIRRMPDGPNAGQYLFSAETVARLKEFYEAVRELPYQETSTPGWYDRYIENPKGLTLLPVFPLRWLIEMPGWLKSRVLGQAVWQWLGAGIALCLGIAIIAAINGVGRYWKRRHPDSRLGPLWIRAVELSVAIAILRGLEFLSGGVLGISVGTHQLIFVLLWAIPTILVAWLAWVVPSAIAETIVVLQQLRERGIDSQLLRLSFRLVAVILVSAVLIEGANRLGLPSYSILTGLGISGLAVALAAREALANLFGSLVIMFEKPFRVGDWIRVGEDEGHVESVGFRSTRIRTFYDSLISIPSSQLIAATVDNLGARAYRRVKTTLAVTYDTPPDQVQAFVEGIKDIIRAHPRTRKDKFHIVFNEFGAHSLDILVYFFLEVADWSAELTDREAIFLEIMQLAERLDVKFAFPTETLHVESLPSEESGRARDHLKALTS
ncbi:MAG: mechanosensitive ion channel family protein [Alphaproteobacteria bacterium]|nr:mechanosensitive ion channel family protein [Alphaproteobacteria bacterium]